jgi:ferritin-like protein
MSEYHEPVAELDTGVRDAHRALVSLKEELEAADWYRQRWACATDPELRRVLEHNLNEEIEHASMLLEWLRRTQPAWDERLRRFLFTEAPLGREGAAEASPAGGTTGSSGVGLGIGSLRGARR